MNQSISSPVPPVMGRISQKYSPRHTAVDIAVPVGTEILCPWDGEVYRVWDDISYGGGLSMLVKHDNGYTTGYAHLSRCRVKVGERVLQGSGIALSGNSGSHTTGPHLHFTLRNANNARIDPCSMIDFI